jgi:hypothetical protein
MKPRIREYINLKIKNMSKKQLLLLCFLSFGAAKAQIGPEVTSWILNPTNATGYGGIVTNVQQVQYSTSNVYISASCVPSYSIGPWNSNPNVPTNQNFVYKITRSPQQNTATATTVGLGHIGVWTNGVSIFNSSDGMSYNNAGVWNRNAYFWEGVSFDNCLGHPAPNGEYHLHVSPRCLYNVTDSSHHSPIIGYAFDGYPVYGAWGYTNVNGTGPIRRMHSSYTTTTTSTRTNGPTVNSTYPVGCFMEDYAYSAGSGDLDARNGRFCVTPEYPAGTYAYFVTLDGNLDPQFPYTFYKTYYGLVQTGNTGPSGGHNTVTESVVTYSPPAGIKEAQMILNYSFYPNPASDHVNIYINDEGNAHYNLMIADITGKLMKEEKNLESNKDLAIDISGINKGIYFLKITNGKRSKVEKLVIE